MSLMAPSLRDESALGSGSIAGSGTILTDSPDSNTEKIVLASVKTIEASTLPYSTSGYSPRELAGNLLSQKPLEVLHHLNEDERVKAFERIFNHAFDPGSYIHVLRSLTHASVVAGGNMVLAQLGDAVIKVLLVEDRYLGGMIRKGDVQEEVNKYLSGGNLAKLCRQIGLSKLIILGSISQSIGEKMEESLLEAAMGCLYLDGGTRAVKRAMRHIGLLP